MKEIECIACGSTKTRQLRYTPRYGTSVLMNCLACGLKFLLSEDYEVLSDDSYWDEVNKKIYAMPNVLEEFKKKHDKYLKYIKMNSPPNMRLLDVGCGNGIFLVNAKASGFEVAGIEPSQIAVELCARQHGITPMHGYLELNSNLPRDYGVVSAWDVIEHVANPKEFLEICSAHLELGGTLLLETPDESCFLRRIINMIDSARRTFGLSAASSIYYPSHRYYFTHRSIEGLLTKAGFSNVRIYRGHTLYSKSKAKYLLYRKYSKMQMMKYHLLFFILKFPYLWNKQVILCTKSGFAHAADVLTGRPGPTAT